MIKLTLRRDNPYTKGLIVEYDDNTSAIYRGKLVYRETQNDKYHLVSEDETLSDIAYNEYGNSKLWWVIADVNNIIDPFLMEVGTSLIIPNINTLKAYNLL